MNRWAIAVACGVINFLILGGARLTPILFVASMERYNSNRQNASFPYVLCFMVRTFLGPAIGFFGHKYGLREITLFGCVVAFVGLGGCSFAEDIAAVTVFWGVLYGVGLGFSTALLPTIIHEHFKSEGTLANGVALAGSSLGALILPGVLQSLLNAYGLSGAQLILSAIFLNSVPAALLLKMSHSNILKSEKSTNNLSNSNFPNENCIKKDLQCIYASEIPALKTQTTNDNSKGHYNTAFNQNDEKLKYINIYKEIPLPPNLSDNKSTVLLDLFLKRRQTLVISNHSPDSKDVSKAPVLLNAFNLNPNISTPQDTTSVSGKYNLTSQPSASKSKFRSLRIFCDPIFLAIMVTQGIFSYVTSVIWTIIFDYVRDKGIDDGQGVYFVMVLPAADMVGRLCLTWVTDKGDLSQVKFGSLCFIFLAIGGLLLVWSSGFVFIMFAEIVFSLFAGVLTVQFPGVINEFVDSEYKTMAMASRHILHAPLSLLTSPLIGYFRGTLKSYDGILYLTSVISFFSGGIMLLIPYLVKCTNRNH